MTLDPSTHSGDERVHRCLTGRIREDDHDAYSSAQALVTSLGPTASAALYLRASVDGVTDNTHFSQYGATKMASLVLDGIREQHLSLVSYLR